MDHFKDIWSSFDPQGTGFIKMTDLRQLLTDLGEPMGFDEPAKHSRNLQDKIMAQLELPIYNEFQSYQFLDVLDALSLKMMVHEEADIHPAEKTVPTSAEKSARRRSSRFRKLSTAPLDSE